MLDELGRAGPRLGAGAGAGVEMLDERGRCPQSRFSGPEIGSAPSPDVSARNSIKQLRSEIQTGEKLTWGKITVGKN